MSDSPLESASRRVAIAVESRFERTPDGATWTKVMNSYALWQRYLDVFDEVLVIARVRDVPSVPSDWIRVEGDRVSVHAVPYFIGPTQYARQIRSVRAAVRNATTPADAVISQGGTIGGILTADRRRKKLPYAMEVIGDPWDMFAPGSVHHPLRPFFRVSAAWRLRRDVAGAQAVTYVTASALQRRYPPAKGAFSTHFSDVQLPDEAYVTSERVRHRFEQEFATDDPKRRAYTLMTVGSMAQMYKAPDIQIRAVKQCVERGWDVRHVMIGDGKHRPELEALAAELGIADRIVFLGQVTAGAPVRAQLDTADIFLLPSRAEGLPRALVEAMARGLPAIATGVGGIPELLAPEDLVEPGDVTALANKIEEFLASPQRRFDAALRNLVTSREYREEIMNERRTAFLRAVRDAVARTPPAEERATRDPELPATGDTVRVPLRPPRNHADRCHRRPRPSGTRWSTATTVSQPSEPTPHDAD